MVELTFDQYTINPMGTKNAVYSNREMYRNLYKEKLDKILVREMGKIDYNLYTDGDNYYIHIKVPSEVIEKFYYDTVIMFYTNDNGVKVQRTLKNYFVKFYSNDPSFVFTFAHAFLENDLFIKDLLPRMSKQAILKTANIKNPKNEVGYVKSIYFAYLIMKNFSLFEKIKFEAGLTQKYNPKTLLANITHADQKVSDRQNAGTELSKKNRISRQKDNIEKNKNRNVNMKSTMTSLSNNVKTSKVTKVVSSIKKSANVKKI